MWFVLSVGRAADRKRDLILDAATRLFSQGAAVTIPAVATEADVARSTVYRYFRDVGSLEEALVAEAVDAGKRAARVRIAAVGKAGGCGGPLTDHLLGVVEEFVRADSRWKVAVTTSHDGAFFEAFAPLVESVLRKAQQRDEILAEVDIEVTARAVLVLTTAAVRFAGQLDFAPDRAMEPLRRLIGALAAKPA